MRERGLWGPPVGSNLDKWMLDMTEGPHRMRKKMIRNDDFYVHYPYRPDQLSNVSISRLNIFHIILCHLCNDADLFTQFHFIFIFMF